MMAAGFCPWDDTREEIERWMCDNDTDRPQGLSEIGLRRRRPWQRFWTDAPGS